MDDPGDIDLLFTDIRLPEGDLGGFDLAEAAREKAPNLKVLYTTGQSVTDGMRHPKSALPLKADIQTTGQHVR